MRPFPAEMRLSPQVWLKGEVAPTVCNENSQMSPQQNRARPVQGVLKCYQLPQGEEDEEGRQLATCHSHSPGRKEEGQRLCPRNAVAGAQGQLWTVGTREPRSFRQALGQVGSQRSWVPLWDPAQHHTTTSLHAQAPVTRGHSPSLGEARHRLCPQTDLSYNQPPMEAGRQVTYAH